MLIISMGPGCLFTCGAFGADGYHHPPPIVKILMAFFLEAEAVFWYISLCVTIYLATDGFLPEDKEHRNIDHRAKSHDLGFGSSQAIFVIRSKANFEFLGRMWISTLLQPKLSMNFGRGDLRFLFSIC
jgi:hypothetical protein